MTEKYSVLTPASPVHFQEQKKLERMTLDRISAIMSPMTTSSALLFPGQIDYERFEKVVQFSMEYFPWIVGALSGNYDTAAVVPRAIDEFLPTLPEGSTLDLSAGYLVLESRISNEDYDGSKPITEYLPTKVHQKMVRVDLAMMSIDGLPIAALKVNQYKNHFVLGYRLNHVFYDQSSIVSFFTFISKVYQNDTFGTESLRIPTDCPLPVFLPRMHIVPPGSKFASKEEFLAATPAGYTTDPMPAMNFGVPTSTNMFFDQSKIEELRRSGPNASQLSTNDILHAILLKATARFTQSQSEGKSAEEKAEKIRLFYARNMRLPLQLGSECIGDYVRVQLFPAKVDHALTTSIIDLSLENRHILRESSESRDQFRKECQWFSEFKDFCPENYGLPNCDFVMDPTAVVVTNWSSFPYEEMKFGNLSAAPLELILEGTPFMAGTGAFIRMSFRYVEGKRQLFASVATRNPDLLVEIERLAEETGLYTCTKSS